MDCQSDGVRLLTQPSVVGGCRGFAPFADTVGLGLSSMVAFSRMHRMEPAQQKTAARRMEHRHRVYFALGPNSELEKKRTT
jgi:hypothetical protein